MGPLSLTLRTIWERQPAMDKITWQRGLSIWASLPVGGPLCLPVSRGFSGREKKMSKFLMAYMR
jgi:hypothetical protein